MYEAVTQGIRVRVVPEYSRDHSEPDEGRWFWVYTIEIANLGERTVQLVSRHWRITDANGRLEEVRGPGVVGKQPMLAPRDTHRYSSGCALATPSGIMSGTYRMVASDGSSFDATIPAFSLDSPDSRRTMN